MRKQWQKMVVIGVALSAWAVPAWAGGYCSTQSPCKSANETCNGNFCVPTAKLCTGDSACQTWEKCDFTCPGGTSSTGGTTVSVDAGSTGSGSADASTSVATDGIMWTDGGKSDPSAPDAANVLPSEDAGPNQPPDDAFYPTMDIEQPKNNCPASPGVCVAVLTKVPAQAGCDAFCGALVPCGFGFGSGTTSSSSGGSSSGGGGTPTPSTDDASSSPSYPDAAPGTDQAMDAGAYDTNMPQLDGGPVDTTPGPEAQAQCVAICSLWVLDHTADTELAALEQCVAGATTCDGISKGCDAQGKAFMTAAEANDAWSLGLGGFGGTSTASGGTTGNTKDSDATTAVFGNADAGATAPQSDSATTAGAASPASSGCTAGSAPQSAPMGLGLLGLLTGALILRRRHAR